jgi:hypothetical protein
MQYMWADTLLAAERAHLLRLALWGGASLLIGTALLATLRAGRHGSALLEHFGLQTAAWGAFELGIALLRHSSLAYRDLAGATRLDRMLWLNVGLDVGFVLVGITLGALGWRVARHLGLVGAGIGVVLQGTALVLLHLVLAGQISR